MQISDLGLNLIAWHEGFSERPYHTLTGAWAIGFGHSYGVSADTPPITELAARNLLQRDIDSSIGPAVDELGGRLGQNQFDATCSFVYQLGVGVLRPSSPFGSRLHAADWESAANAMLLYTTHEGAVIPELDQRRQLERALFLASDPSPPAPLDVLTHSEREAVDRYDTGSGADGTITDELAAMRQVVWLAAVRGRDADGGAVPTGWDIDFRAQRYALLAERSGWKR